jgi:hypothetical protein
MHQRLVSSFVIVAAIFLAIPALAVEFQPIGFESASMGGAGVASARGSYAPYYNPALLAEHKHGAQISLSAGVGMREVNVAEHIDRLADIDIDETIDLVETSTPIVSDSKVYANLDTSARNNITTIKNELRALSGRNGLQIMPSVSLGIQAGNFGFGAYGVSEATAYAVIDPNRLDIIIQKNIPAFGETDYVEYDETTDEFTISSLSDYQASSLEYALENVTYLKLTGLAYLEIPIAYGHQFTTAWGKLNCGASFKIMPGYTYDATIKIDTESGDVDSELEDVEERDTSWGIDLGLLFKPTKLPKLSLGLVGKNLNTPEFDTATGDTLKVKPQGRAGLAYDFWGDRLTVAIDGDLTKNETFIPDYDSQFIGGGINFHPFSWLSLRCGAMQNIQESDDGTIYTAGLGFGLKWFQLDVTGQASDKKGEYEDEEIPRYARVQVALVSKWF